MKINIMNFCNQKWAILTLQGNLHLMKNSEQNTMETKMTKVGIFKQNYWVLKIIELKF